MTKLSAILGKPFRQQVAAFRLRLGNLVPTATWEDVWQAEHDRAFMVAGAIKADLLSDLAAAVDKAISGGGTLETFRRDFRAIVEKNGWHGWTGEGTEKGEAWRTKVIYKTNMATSYAAGRWAQLMQAGFRYIIYHHGNSREPRVQHLAWDGLVLPVEHPFWATHAPPNGWGCSCYVSGARSLAGAQRLGGDPDKALPPGWQTLNPKTGAPVGIDKGWAYAPGASIAATVAGIADRAVHWDYNLAVAYMSALPEATRDSFAQSFRGLPSLATEIEQFALKAADHAQFPGLVAQRTLGLATRAQMKVIEAIAQLAVRDGLYDYALDKDTVRHVLGRHGDPAIEASRGQQAIVPEDFSLLARIINDPDAILPADQVPGRGLVVRFEKEMAGRRYVALFELRTGRRRLALVTMWIEKIAGASPTATP